MTIGFDEDLEGAAKAFERAVRHAFVRVYGAPKDATYLERSILSSFLPQGRRLKWTEPRPDGVLVLTEFSWVQDPYTSPFERAKWDKVMKVLQDAGWPGADYDSINAAVQIVFVRVPLTEEERLRLRAP